MTTRSGKPWSATLPEMSGRDLLGETLAAIGVIASLCVIAVSATLNFRMGFRSADTVMDGWVYGMGTGACDVIKALAPFMAFWGLKRRDWMVVGSASTVYTVFTVFSFVAALGFAAEHRSHKTAIAIDGIEKRQLIKDELATATEKLRRIGIQRSSASVESAINAELKFRVGPRLRTVDEISNRCTSPRIATREACARIAKLEVELQIARDWETQAVRADSLRTKLAGQGGTTAAQQADPQVWAVGKLAKPFVSVDHPDVAFGLAVLLAILIELGSGLGLFIATTPWRTRDALQQPQAQASPLEIFALECLEPAASSELHLTELFEHYTSWSKKNRLPHLNRQEFRERFKLLASEAGIRNRIRRGQEIYDDIRVVVDFSRRAASALK